MPHSLPRARARLGQSTAAAALAGRIGLVFHSRLVAGPIHSAPFEGERVAEGHAVQCAHLHEDAGGLRVLTRYAEELLVHCEVLVRLSVGRASTRLPGSAWPTRAAGMRESRPRDGILVVAECVRGPWQQEREEEPRTTHMRRVPLFLERAQGRVSVPRDRVYALRGPHL